MAQIEVESKLESLDTLNDFVHSVIRNSPCTEQQRIQIDLVLEELFVNIVNYAYPESIGKVQVECKLCEDLNQAIITFKDRGIEFNPLARKEIEIHERFERRPVGGLGIYLAKKYTDSIEYERAEDCNVLTIMKNLG